LIKKMYQRQKRNMIQTMFQTCTKNIFMRIHIFPCSWNILFHKQTMFSRSRYRCLQYNIMWNFLTCRNPLMFWRWRWIFQCHNPRFRLATKAKGLQGCEPKGRKPGSQGKGIARVQAKRKSGN
jgi:hypothetical protein